MRLACICLAVTLQLSSVLCCAEPLLVGVAETEITPPNGFPIAGYYHERLAEGTIDPLKAKAMVFSTGQRQRGPGRMRLDCDLSRLVPGRTRTH